MEKTPFDKHVDMERKFSHNETIILKNSLPFPTGKGRDKGGVTGLQSVIVLKIKSIGYKKYS